MNIPVMKSRLNLRDQLDEAATVKLIMSRSKKAAIKMNIFIYNNYKHTNV